MALQGSGYYKTVGGVAMHIGEKTCARGDGSIHGYLDQSLIQKFAAPSVQVEQELKVAFLDSHADFPERYGRHCGLTTLKRVSNGESSSWSQPPVAALMPKQDMRV